MEVVGVEEAAPAETAGDGEQVGDCAFLEHGEVAMGVERDVEVRDILGGVSSNNSWAWTRRPEKVRFRWRLRRKASGSSPVHRHGDSARRGSLGMPLRLA